ncbi:MAG: hypothetical protein ABUS51_05240 [Acidobacteriota bacterium]
MTEPRKVIVNGEEVTPEFFRDLERDKDLKELTIWSGPLTNETLEPVGRLTRLKGLCLGEMQIDDGVFRYLQPLRSLEYLNLAYTNIRGDFSPLAGAPLRDVRLEGCRLAGDACAASLAAFPTLRNAEVHMTGVTDAGVTALSALPLETLWAGPRITDTGLQSIGRIPTLRHLDLCAHMVTDEGAAALAKLRGIEILWLTRCSITDRSVPVLAELQSLRELNVSHTGITGPGLARLRAALPSTRFVEPD